MKLLIDTHIWIWWVSRDPQLRPSDGLRIASVEEVAVSAISIWEVAMLQQSQRIELSSPIEEWLDIALTGAGIQVQPLGRSIAFKAATLPFHHRDPADRLIIASALCMDCSLLSYDRKFRLYSELGERLISKGTPE
ncbi:MAG: type II toxin-antitoxin system VapC family toxin [Candidatus Sericytochromatia bacterium]